MEILPDVRPPLRSFCGRRVERFCSSLHLRSDTGAGAESDVREGRSDFPGPCQVSLAVSSEFWLGCSTAVLNSARSSWYRLRIIAPHYFRMALWGSVGQRRGDAHFCGTLKVQGGTTAPTLWGR